MASCACCTWVVMSTLALGSKQCKIQGRARGFEWGKRGTRWSLVASIVILQNLVELFDLCWVCILLVTGTDDVLGLEREENMPSGSVSSSGVWSCMFGVLPSEARKCFW